MHPTLRTLPLGQSTESSDVDSRGRPHITSVKLTWFRFDNSRGVLPGLRDLSKDFPACVLTSDLCDKVEKRIAYTSFGASKRAGTIFWGLPRFDIEI